ncbi:BGTF surface domain-containing protein [Halobellus litoreus]|uniref:BGTF surface domain-containing protein n=1 Tax=Halobellus litoreus TaxID=755310 RepID=A0ABD6E232_9EURY
MCSRRRARVLIVIVVASALATAALSGSVAADPSVSVDRDGDTVTVANGTSQVVSGTADAPVGTEIVVRVRSASETEPVFLKSASGVVTENGTWAVAFDFESQRAGDTFALTARFENGTAETEVDGAVVACGEDCAERPPSGTPTPIPEQTPTATRTAGPSAPVAFGENVFLVESGTVAAIPITFDGAGRKEAADEAVVVLGNESESNYELEAVVSDDDGDGQAVLYVDTALAGRSEETLSTSGGDSVRVESETSLESMLGPAEYDVSLYAGGERAGEADDVGSLVIQAATTRAAATSTPSTHAERESGTNGIGLGPLALSGVVSGAFLVGGAALAAVLLKD